MQYVDGHGARLAFASDGAAHLPWLVVSNSLAADHRLWDPQLAALTPIRRVVRYDTLGHGKSSAAAGPYDFKLLCGDAIAIMVRLDIGSADVLGLSLGGMTVLGRADRGGPEWWNDRRRRGHAGPLVHRCRAAPAARDHRTCPRDDPGHLGQRISRLCRGHQDSRLPPPLAAT